MECTSLLVKLGINYPQTIISMELIKSLQCYHEGKEAAVEQYLILNPVHSISFFSAFFHFPS